MEKKVSVTKPDLSSRPLRLTCERMMTEPPQVLFPAWTTSPEKVTRRHGRKRWSISTGCSASLHDPRGCPNVFRRAVVAQFPGVVRQCRGRSPVLRKR